MRYQPRHHRLVKQWTTRLLEASHRRAYPARHQHFPAILFNTLPKSGSKFILRSLQRTLQIDMIRINYGGVSKVMLDEPAFNRFAEGNLICQEHLPAEPHIVAALELKVPRVVIHLRDPRAALLSWVHHLNVLYPKGHIIAILQSVEGRMPEKYFEWSVPDQLAWQVDNFLPKMVQWVAQWMDVDNDPARKLSIMVTTHEELAASGSDIQRRILDFYGIQYQPDWIRDQAPTEGKWNFRTGKTKDWRESYPPALLERATSLLAARECQRFGWE